MKKATSKYILKSSLAAKKPENMRFGRRRSLSCPSSPTTRWENPLKRVVNNELTVKVKFNFSVYDYVTTQNVVYLLVQEVNLIENNLQPFNL